LIDAHQLCLLHLLFAAGNDASDRASGNDALNLTPEPIGPQLQ
jgi:hypothetical protein